MSEQPLAFEATAENFAQPVLANSHKGPLLVYFWARWAGPSLRQREVLLRLAGEYGGRFLLVTLDTGRQKEIARRMGVKSLPSCKLFRNGKAAEHLQGMRTESDYRELIERHILPLTDKVQLAAWKAWRSGDRESAAQIPAEGAMAEPESEMLAALDGAPERSETRFALAAVYLIADDYSASAALEQLAELHRRDPDHRSGLPRRTLLAVLSLLGPDDERTGRYRRVLFEH
jgi:thioredoxin-like negative regulator of GroEL